MGQMTNLKKWPMTRKPWKNYFFATELENFKHQGFK